jgi:hypothetical protein
MPIASTTNGISSQKNTRFFLGNDALHPPDVPNIISTASDGPEPGFYETSEYMIGSVAVGVIFLESNGETDPSTEDWTPTEESKVTSEIQQALNWWAEQNPDADVSFVYDWHYGVPTTYEPIIHPSGATDNTYEQLWVSEAMAHLGYTSGDWMYRTRSYINDLRDTKRTDWSFAVYVVDSSNDGDGCFSDGYSAYAYYGIFLVMTYDNNGWGIDLMNRVMAHETGHIFWATDEYDGVTEYSGYLNAADVEGSGCLMDTCSLTLSSGTWLQVGWRDSDDDGILDIVDTYPETTLNPYSPDPTTDAILTYTGTATVVPHPNDNPQPTNSGNSVSINKISNVQYRVDYIVWMNARPSDEEWDEAEEEFTFTTSYLSSGLHLIEARAVNTEGNIDPTPDTDEVTVETTNEPPDIPTTPFGPTEGLAGVEYTYKTSTTDPDDDDVKYGWDIEGDGEVDFWTDFYSSGETCSVEIIFNTPDTYYVQVKAEDIKGAQTDFSHSLRVVISGDNNPPDIPSTPSGPTSGDVGISYTYTTTTSDPDGHSVRYGWDWDGDTEVDEWSGLYTPGQTVSRSHIWNAPGTYYVQVKAKDEHEAESDFSPPLTVVISGVNTPPEKPGRPYGQTYGKIGVRYNYTSRGAVDPDGDQVFYKWDWGDGTMSKWLGPFDSGQEVEASHTWDYEGDYEVKVKAKDIHGDVSPWSDPLSVTIPKNRKVFSHLLLQLLEKLMERFPLLKQMLQMFPINRS